MQQLLLYNSHSLKYEAIRNDVSIKNNSETFWQATVQDIRKSKNLATQYTSSSEEEFEIELVDCFSVMFF